VIRLSKKQGKELKFKDPVAWNQAVNGVELVQQISDTISRHIVLPQHSETAIPLWILHAWTLDAFYLSPILRITSPTKGCGKSNLLILVGNMLPRHFLSSNLTVATIFRLVDKHKISLAIDEADQSFRNNEEMVSLINTGYLRQTSNLPRCVGDKHEVHTFSTWGPKVIAGIGRLTETTESRCLAINLNKKTKRESVQRVPNHQLNEILNPLKRKCLRWANDNMDKLKESNPLLPDELADRPADNWFPLLAIADLIGGNFPDLARKAAIQLSHSGDTDEEAAGVLLLEDIWDHFQEASSDRLTSKEIVERLVEMEERPWPEWRQGREITPTGVARLLKPFAVRPKQFKDDSGKKQRGYSKEQFLDPVIRYGNGTKGTSLKSNGLEKYQDGTDDAKVPFEDPENFLENNEVPPAPDENPLFKQGNLYRETI
jgi:putative DNA primase/helicase